MLSTLEELGMVEQAEPGGSYRVGSGMIEIAAAVLPGRSIDRRGATASARAREGDS